MKKLKLLVILSFASAAWSQCTLPYYQRSITVNAAQVTGTLSNFAVLVLNPTSGAANPANLKTTGNGGRVTSANGYDIIFVDSGGTSLPFEMVGHGTASTTYSATTGNAEFWVDVTSLSTGSVFYMCYGNSGVTTYQGNDTGTWNSTYKGVWHGGTASNLSIVDSKGNNTSTNHSVAAGTGKIGGGMSFAAASSYLELGSSAVASTPMTFCAWLNQPSFAAFHGIFGNSGQFNGLESDQQITTGDIRLNKQNVVGIGNSTTALTLATFTHMCMTYDATSGALAYYINGAAAGTATTTAALTFADTWLGASADFTTGLPAGFWLGDMDEVEIYNAVQTSAWIQAQYNNQSAPSSFYAVGGEAIPGASMTASPTTIPNSTVGQVITLTGTNTTWDGTTIFTASGGCGTITAQNVTGVHAATVTVTTNSGTCTLTISETITGGVTANVTVYGSFTTQVYGVTSQQIVLKYTPPAGGTCTIQVSESPSLTPVVHDVDATLFSGANSDGGTPASGVRTWVVGKRKAERDLNGKWQSRSLQAFTPQYFQITCGSAISIGYAHTTNLVLGNTYNEPAPADPAVATKGYFAMTGMHAWPEMTWTDGTVGVVDPQTGMLIKTVLLPGQQPTGGGDANLDSASNPFGTWVNPQNIVLDDGNSATYSGTTRDPIFGNVNLAAQGVNLFSATNPVESLLFNVKGSCTGACVGTDAAISVCLTLDNVSCWAGGKTIDVTLTTSMALHTVGTTTPILDSWTAAGYQPLSRGDLSARLASVNVDAGGVVSWIAGASTTYFNPNWSAGTHIGINSQDCTIASVNGYQELTITPASCPGLTLPATGVDLFGYSFSWMIRKKTTSTDTISLQYVYYTAGDSQVLDYSSYSSGSAKFSADGLISNGSGGLGYYNVVLTGAPELFWVDHVTGNSTYLGIFNLTAVAGPDGFGTNFSQCSAGSLVATSSTAANFYCIAYDNETPTAKEIVVQCVIASFGASPVCTNLTKGSLGKELLQLVIDFSSGDTPAYDGSWGGCGLSGIQGVRLIMSCNTGGQDILSWTVIFDPTLVGSSAGCVGGGAAGCVVGVESTWGHTPARWCVLHTQFVAGNSNLSWIAGKFLQDQGLANDGPYTVTLTSALLTSTPTIAAGVGTCPGGSQGCDNITVNGEPCDPSPHGENVGPRVCPTNPAFAFLQNAAVGDVLAFDDGGERLKIVVKNSSTSWQVQRGYGYPGNPNSQYPGPQNHAGTRIYMWCAAQDFSGTGAAGISNWSWTWDFISDPHGTGTGAAVAYDYDHPTPRTEATVGGAPSYDTGCTSGTCYAMRVGSSTPMGDPPNMHATAAPAFSGASGPTRFFERAQDHPSRLQGFVSTAESSWLLDGRPSEFGSDIADTATAVTGTLYKMTSTTTDGDNLTFIGGAGAPNGGVNRKSVPSLVYCGTQGMIDISSSTLGDTITGLAADAYNYCIARKAGECRSASAQGDVYYNCPNAVKRGGGTYGCGAGQNSASIPVDMCIANSSQYLNAVEQVGFPTADFTGALGRTLTKGLMGYRVVNAFLHGRAFYDSSWVQVPALWTGGVWTPMLVMKLPAYPPIDTVNRQQFVQMPIIIPTGPAGTTNAIIEFGYLENGTATQYYCTSRHEPCVAGTSTTPFAFPTDGSGGVETGLTGTSCAAGCTVNIPTLSNRVLYYTIKFRDSGNATLTTSTGMRVTP